jgi:hypothetical protein
MVTGCRASARITATIITLTVIATTAIILAITITTLGIVTKRRSLRPPQPAAFSLVGLATRLIVLRQLGDIHRNPPRLACNAGLHCAQESVMEFAAT